MCLSSSPGHEGLFKPLGLEGPPAVRGALEEREILFSSDVFEVKVE